MRNESSLQDGANAVNNFTFSGTEEKKQGFKIFLLAAH